MVKVEELKRIYCEKLMATGSMDAAFTKAVWVAYKQGLADGKAEVTNPSTTPSTADTSYANAHRS